MSCLVSRQRFVGNSSLSRPALQAVLQAFSRLTRYGPDARLCRCIEGRYRQHFVLADGPQRLRCVEWALRDNRPNWASSEVGQLPNTYIDSTATSSPSPALPRPFERYRSHIEVALREPMNGHTSPLYDMLRYSMGWSDASGTPTGGTTGKALRPVLCLYAAKRRAANMNPHSLLPRRWSSFTTSP